MPKCPTCGNEIVRNYGHELDNSEALSPAHPDDELELLTTAELPGIDEKDVEVVEVKFFGGNTLTITGQRRVESEGDGDDGIRSSRRSIRLLVHRAGGADAPHSLSELHSGFAEALVCLPDTVGVLAFYHPLGAMLNRLARYSPLALDAH